MQRSRLDQAILPRTPSCLVSRRTSTIAEMPVERDSVPVGPLFRLIVKLSSSVWCNQQPLARKCAFYEYSNDCSQGTKSWQS
jgi:hypothetical protein